jgi:hypothetical protein
MNWTDPKNTTEWLARFTEVQADLDAITIPEPLKIAAGEILQSTNEINVAFLDVSRTYKDLGAVKDKARRLSVIAERWYKGEKAKAILEAGRDRETYPSDELRKAYAENKTIGFLENWQAAQVLLEAIHDERSRLFQYRGDLEQIGHNIRQEMKF